VEEAFQWDLSPDGSRIAVLGYGSRISILSLSEKVWHSLAIKNLPGIINFLSWTPDGKHLFFSASSYDNPMRGAIFRATLEGKTQLLWRSAVQEVVDSPVPSPDGKYLAFNTMAWDGNVWLLENF
jgi:Tol biopolymer transport system component